MLPLVSGTAVALRKESVDRNFGIASPSRVMRDVALRKESVDRNRNGRYRLFGQQGSLSARRAWIEIARYRHAGGDQQVALRKESVDRNWCQLMVRSFIRRSLSARRAWIEIWCYWCRNWCRGSLSARRAWIEMPKIQPGTSTDHRRSPQGERG